MRHFIIWGVTLSAVFTLASCHKKPPVAVPSATPTSITYQMSDGLQITPLDVEHNEIADILAIQMWRFHVVCPSPETHIHYVLELRKKGQTLKEVVNSTMWGLGIADSQMVVALYPLGGEVHTADKLKTHIRIAGSGASGIEDNPMKGLGGSSRDIMAKRQDDESFLLMEFSQGGTVPDPNNMRLVLTINAAKPEDNPR